MLRKIIVPYDFYAQVRDEFIDAIFTLDFEIDSAHKSHMHAFISIFQLRVLKSLEIKSGLVHILCYHTDISIVSIDNIDRTMSSFIFQKRLI